MNRKVLEVIVILSFIIKIS